ncbi:PREDICTED: equilibrative nucleotide transporter 3 [Tarenaya hassleriana]|uniref:equilibrative nucleotide transporter 3 n=1 Tax=Tarenaya hassleriana TaxID=28532 RepID=UPI00053C5BAE|nr:PREDICTED: equilibrative nucleotide transporter 3 [Tarenaya hassleriana]XP_010533855.1 PREDICTED: equilibrative nucleotide transporter 3 [Tarenaya hassleriana]
MSSCPENENAPPTRLEGKFQALVVCCFLGLGSLVAWNSMLTIADYYYQVFPDYHPSRVLTLVYQPFACATIAILAYYEAKINTRKRNIFGYALYTVSTFLLIVLDLATKGQGGVIPYVLLCLIVASFGLADAHVQGGMVGDLSFMCPEFIQSFMGGLGISGALTSCLRLMTKAIFDKSPNGLRKGALLFLAISTLIELLCIFLYAYVFPKLPIVKYYRAKAAAEGAKTVSADLMAAGLQDKAAQVAELDQSKIQRRSNKQLLRENIDHGINLYLVYVVTLSIFPGFLYENTGEHQLGTWYPLVLVAAYNCWDTVSRYIPMIKCLALESRKWLTVCVLARFALVPAFYFTAKYADQGWMIFLTSFLGLTNGYLTVCILSAAPKGYNGPESNALGNLLVGFLLGGIFSGVCLDWLWLIPSKTAF